jgi:hypothetical protein
MRAMKSAFRRDLENVNSLGIESEFGLHCSKDKYEILLALLYAFLILTILKCELNWLYMLVEFVS